MPFTCPPGKTIPATVTEWDGPNGSGNNITDPNDLLVVSGDTNVFTVAQISPGVFGITAVGANGRAAGITYSSKAYPAVTFTDLGTIQDPPQSITVIYGVPE